VLDEDLVLEDTDLGEVVLLPDHHHPVDRLAASKELRLADDRGATPAGLATFSAPLLLRLEAGRPADAGDLVLGVARLARPVATAGVVVVRAVPVLAGTAAAPATTGPRALGRGLLRVVRRGVLLLVGVVLATARLGVRGLAPAATTAATTTAGTAISLAALVVGVRTLLRGCLVRLVGVLVVLGRT
jgi:hypothetical protein